MEITHKQMQNVFELVQNASTATLKKLTPSERKAVKVMMEALQQGDDFLMLKGFETKDLSRLKDKLGLRMVQSHKSPKMKQIMKGVSALMGKSVSIATLSHAIDRTKVALNEQKKTGEDIATKKSSLENRIAEHEAMAPIMKEIREFFRDISSEPFSPELKKKLREKKEELEGKAKQLQASQKLENRFKLSTLENAVSSLKELEKATSENWEPLISLYLSGWGGEHRIDQASIERERQEIEKLSRQKGKKEPFPFFKHKPKRSTS